MTAGGMRRLIDSMIARHPESLCLNMMFHSMEIIPQASPYVRTRAGQRRFLQRLESALHHARACHCRFLTAGEMHHAWT